MVANPQRIVVGVDGSAGSRAALGWAFRYAGDSGGEVTALLAWAPPTYRDLASRIPEDDSEERAERVLQKVVDEAAALLDTRIPVRRKAVQGTAARSLLKEAQGADLLVVGSRGHGGFVGALLGSVSQHCVHHAPCPVVVVRHTPTPTNQSE